MLSFLLSQVRHRRSRTITLGLGILVAAVSFTLLTAAVSTSQLQVLGTIAHNFRPAYDILVRPQGSFTPLERQQNLIQDNYLSGIFGGITLQQYREIKDIPGVDVAAPIANIGYILAFQPIPITINRFLNDDPTQMYRLDFSWLANNGLSRYPDSPQYVYYTRRNRFRRTSNGPYALLAEVLANGKTVPACLPFTQSVQSHLFTSSPFSLTAQTSLNCFSSRSPGLAWPIYDQGRLPRGDVGMYAFVFFPILLSAIDPSQESKLVDLGKALVGGRLLRSGDAVQREPAGPGVRYKTIPILISTRNYLDESLRMGVERLALPPDPKLHRSLSSVQAAYPFVNHLTGREVGHIAIPARGIYADYLRTVTAKNPRLRITYDGYWTSSPVRYEQVQTGHLSPLTTRNPEDVFRSSYGAGWAPWEDRDTQFRRLTAHGASTTFSGGGVYPLPSVRVIGRFDPDLLPGFSALSEVPLETYYPPSVLPANAATRRALGDQPLLPTMNLGGYVSAPPLMLTNLGGLRAFTDPQAFNGVNDAAPISVIRVRIAGVTGPDPVSRERIRRVAELIHQRTGLAVDITAGSSPRQLLVQLPAGKFGQPPLSVREGWVEKGVGVRFLQALDRKSLALFLLVLVVCAFFLANGAFASVRARRREIGTLLCLGWSRASIFRAVLGELTLIGFVAGLAGTGLAAGLVNAFSLKMSILSTLLVTPIAGALAVIAGSVPAFLAARSTPLDAVQPAIAGRVGGKTIRGITGMALTNVRRLPSRTLLAALGLFVGVAALAMVLAIDLAFHGVLVGTLLGGFISVQVRGVDVASVLLAVGLGGFSVADVLFLNLRERAPELATLRAAGWRETHLRKLVTAEGLAIGLLGSLPGAVGGVTIALAAGGLDARVILAGVAGAAGGVLVALAASLVPASLISRMTPSSVLAEE